MHFRESPVIYEPKILDCEENAGPTPFKSPETEKKIKNLLEEIEEREEDR
jgi:hypothetical protein